MDEGKPFTPELESAGIFRVAACIRMELWGDLDTPRCNFGMNVEGSSRDVRVTWRPWASITFLSPHVLDK